MAFTQLTASLALIAALGDQPNSDDGLTAAALKAKFDEAAGLIKTYINGTLLVELADHTATGGASKIGVHTASLGNDLQTVIDALIAAGAGGLPPDGSITNAKMATDVKVGSLTALTTTDKDSITDAIIELVTRIGLDETALTTHKTSTDHDSRYYTETEMNAGQMNTLYYTESEIDTKMNAKVDENILTTAGDIAYATGASTWARLAIGTVGQVPAVNSGTTALEYVTVPRAASGSYTGNDGTDRTISLSFTPKVVLIESSLQFVSIGFSAAGYGFKINTAGAAVATAANAERPATTTNGFVVSGTSTSQTNRNGQSYNYIAIG